MLNTSKVIKLGQWQDFNFPNEEFLQPAITKQRAVEVEKGLPSAHRASSATADPIQLPSARDLELEICLQFSPFPMFFRGSQCQMIEIGQVVLKGPLITSRRIAFSFFRWSIVDS